MLLIPACGLLPVVVAVLARAAGAHVPMGMEMGMAAGVAVIVTLAAAAGIWAGRNLSQVAVFQTALAATVGQMGLMAAAVLGAWALGLTGNVQRFALWILAYYWVELPALAAVAVQVIRRAKPEGSSGAAAGGSPAPAH
jgi:hypothetical protein